MRLSRVQRSRCRNSMVARGVATAFAAAFLTSACGAGEEGETTSEDAASGAVRVPAWSPDQAPSPVAERFSDSAASVTYDGTLTIGVDYYSLDCQFRDADLHLIGSRTYEMPVQVVRGPPAEAEGIRESSPFNLIVGANPGNEAGITTISATVATDFRGAPVLFEYWKIDVQGSAIQGELTNGWRQAGLSANIFPTVRPIDPCHPELGVFPMSLEAIEEGARLEGSINDDRADLTITGQILDHTRRFVARVAATRTEE